MHRLGRLSISAFLIGLSALCGACADKTVVITAPQTATPRDDGAPVSTIGQILVNGPSTTGEEAPGSYSVIRFRNRLNRTISIDILGRGHVEMSVGDARTDSAQVSPGNHSVSISAPGLKAAKLDVSLDAGRVYVIEVYGRSSKD